MLKKKAIQKLFLKIIRVFFKLTVYFGLTNYYFSAKKNEFLLSLKLTVYRLLFGLSFLILYPLSFLTLLKDFQTECKGVTDYVRNSTYVVNAVICSIIYFSSIRIFHSSQNVEIYNKGLRLYQRICAIEGLI